MISMGYAGLKNESGHMRTREDEADPFLGSSIGIAGAFGAIAGTIPGALLGAYVARRMAYRTPTCPNCGFKHIG